MDPAAPTPRQRANSPSHSGIASERSRQTYAARLLCRSSKLLHASQAFSAWAAATRERKLKGHMNRCSIMMKHSTMRQDYSRFFLRWLAFTQARTYASYCGEICIRKDVPLRSKADFLALGRRYFNKWRTHLRQKKQRSAANVDLLVALNRERLRSRALLRWWRFCRANCMKRHNLEVREHMDTIRQLQAEVRRTVNEAETLRDRLSAALQTQARLQEELDASRDDFDGSLHRQQTEIRELRESMRAVMEMVEGGNGPQLRSLRKWGVTSPDHKSNQLTIVVDTGVHVHGRSPTPEMPSSPPPTVSVAVADSAVNSTQQSKYTQAALVRCVESAIAALADLRQATTAPLSVMEAIENVRRRLDDDAEELAVVQAQRDELAAAVRAARLAFASISPSLAATVNTISETELDVSRAPSVASSRLGGTFGSVSNMPAARASHRTERSGNRRSGAAAIIINGSLPNVYLPSGTSTPSISVPDSPGESKLMDSQDLPRLLVTDAKNVVNIVSALRKSEQEAKDEVTDLQDAAMRAIDALGGSGVASDDFAAAPDETSEARAQRSGAIATSLRNLCEDMIVVLVLTSMWSGKRASERVSEALERLWRCNQDLEAAHTSYLQQLEDLTKIIHVTTRLLRPSPTGATGAPSSAASTPHNVIPWRASTALASRRHTVVSAEKEVPPTLDELDDARRTADDLAVKGDNRPAELLWLCEAALKKDATQFTMLTSELEGLLQSSQDLLAATVGVEKEAATPRLAGANSASAAAPTVELSVSSREQRSESSTTMATVSTAAPMLNPQEVMVALRAAARKVARVVTKVGDTADTPLMVATQDVLGQLEQAKKTHTNLEKQLRVTEAQITAMESQHSKEKSRSDAAEKKLRQQLEALGEQHKQGEALRKQLEAKIKEAESQAWLIEKGRKKELDDAAKAHKAAEKELQEQLKALEQEVEQQAQERQRSEKEIKALQDENREAEKTLQMTQENLKKEKAAHVRTQEALDAQLKASMSDIETTKTAMAKLHEQLQALQEECRHTEDEKRHLEEDLKKKQSAHEQALKDCEEQREMVQTERRLHAKELEKARDIHRTIEEENKKLTADIQKLEQKLQDELEKQHSESDAARHGLEDQLATAKAASEADAAARVHLEQQLLYVEGENRVNNAVGVFLRDVLRDCLTRLHHLTRSIGDAEPLSPRASLTLQQASNKPPPLLTHDSDPSDYVEYILRLDGNDSIGKRLVQEHLRENSSVHGVKLPLLRLEEDREPAATIPGATAPAAEAAASAEGASTSPAGTDMSDPSTWEVVAELHDRFVLLYERFAQLDQAVTSQLTLINALSSEKKQLCADALMTLQQLQPWSSAASTAAATVSTPVAKSASRSISPGSALVLPQNIADGASISEPVSAIQADVAGAALCTSSSEIAQALAALQLAADSVRPLMQLSSSKSASRCASGTPAVTGAGSSVDTAMATEHLQTLVADVQDMASCLQHLTESVHHGITALGGATSDHETEDGDGSHRTDRTLPGGQSASSDGTDAHGVVKDSLNLGSLVLASRLEAICKETGASILEVKYLLLGGDGKSDGESDATASQATAKPLKLADVIPRIRAKVAELEDVKRESARLLNGLNHAFDDDEESLFAASMSSTHSRSLRPKKKPLPAFQGTPEAGLRLLQQKIKGKKGRSTGAPPNSATAIGSFGSHIRDRLGDLQNLRLVCRNTLQLLEGRTSTEDDGQPLAYGETLVTLLTTQVEDLKLALVESDEVLKGYRSDLRNVTVGTRLHLLTDVVNSLKLERDSLKEDINRRGRQGNMLLDDLNKEAKALRAELAAHQHASAQLTMQRDAVSMELGAQKRNAVEVAARLAQLQHEWNVLSTALAKTLRGLPASTYYGERPALVEKMVQTALKTDQGDALIKCVDKALSAAEQHHQQLCKIFHCSFADLNSDLQALRKLVMESWTRYGASMAEAAAQLVRDTMEVLTLENDMLRPRAVEREKLKGEVATLRAALDDVKAVHKDAIDRLSHLNDENMQLRRALHDAEMAQVLNSAGNTTVAASRQLESRVVDWERRMIAGATDLAMDAIDSMSGQSLSAVFGAVAEETLRVYTGARESLRSVSQACVDARGTDGRRLWEEVEACLHDLNTLSASADYLHTRLPVLYRVSYQ